MENQNKNRRSKKGIVTDIADTQGLTLVPSEVSSKELTAILKEKIITGEVDILTAFAFLKKMAKIVKNLTDDKEIKAILLDEGEQLLPVLKNKKVLGVKITQSSTSKYDYSDDGKIIVRFD